MKKKIPNRIIQFWHNKKVIPEVYREAKNNNTIIASEMEELYVDDKYMLDFLKDRPFLYEVYRRLEVKSIRSDIARLTLLYEYGGIYMDMSIMLHKPIYSLIDVESDVALLRRDDQPRYSKYPNQAHIGAMILSAAPQSSFIASCLKQLMDTIIGGHYNHHILFAATKYTDDVYNHYLDQKDKNQILQTLSFKTLKKDYLKHIRMQGVGNSWKAHEVDGIFKPEDLKQLQKLYIKVEDDLFNIK